MNFKALLLPVLIAALGPGVISAQDETPENPILVVDDGIYKDFYGTPLLSELGYKAEQGTVNVSVGQINFSNIDNITDNDPDNYASTISLIDLTVAIDDRLRILPDEEYWQKKGQEVPVFKAFNEKTQSATEVGFVVSLEGSNASVLDLNIAKLFVFYFYKNGKVVASTNATADDLTVLGLTLISIDGGRQKLTVKAPEKDNDGNPLEFDGIGFGLGGLDVDVAQQLRVYYGFIDQFVPVPIVHKYYPKAWAKTTGMTTGADYLVNNDLSDGASTAVLKIGDVSYTVMSGYSTPFPAGVEAGFSITSGTVLDLDLGQALQIRYITYPKNDDGTYNTAGQPVYGDWDTNVGVVDLQLIGGGEKNVCFKTTEPSFGFELRLISVVNLNLGAQVIHNAYVKLTDYPESLYPFSLSFEAIPSSTFEEEKENMGIFSKAHNTYSNVFKLFNDPSNPLKTPDSYSGEGTKIWRHSTIAELHNVLDVCDYVPLILTRTIYHNNDEMDEQGNNITATEEYIAKIYILKRTATLGKDYQYTMLHKDGSSLPALIDLPSPGEDGVLSFEGVDLLQLTSILAQDNNFREEFNINDTENNDIRAFEYNLYFIHDENNNTDFTGDNSYHLDVDEINLPQIYSEYQMAGTHTYEEIAADVSDAEPDNTLRVSEYGRYVIITVPKILDYKSRITALNLRRYKAGTGERYTSEWSGTYALNDAKWEATPGSMEIVEQIVQGGAYQLLFWDKNSDNTADYEYGIDCSLSLSEKYLTTNNITLAADHKLDYGSAFVPVLEHAVPEMQHEMFQYGYMIWSNLLIPFLTSEGRLNHAEEYGPIYFNEWASVSDMDNVDPQFRSRSIFRAAEEDSDPEPTYGPVVVSKNDTRQTTVLNNCAYFANEYTSDGHTATTTSEVREQDVPLKVSNTVRAYVPVRPEGYSDAANTYLVLQSQNSRDVTDVTPTGIDAVEVIDEINSGRARYFNIMGQQITHPVAGGFYIRHTPSSVAKVIVR